MNNRTQISNFKKSLFFVMGILVAVFVVAQEVIDYHCERISTETESAEHNDGTDEKEVVYEYTFELALPSAVVQLQAFIPVFIHSVIRESEEGISEYPKVPLYTSLRYKNLFRQTISPNAP
ncbi:MAG: hypothetical protein ACJAS3_003016 [Roseivirga sp.]|jgi:hypothetical protein